VTFYPQLSPRLNKKFSELSWARGPLQIGVTGAGTYEVLYGSDWLTLIDVNRRLEAYQLVNGNWVNQSESLLLPPVFDTQLPAGTKRLTHAFDQAARIICAYQDESGIIRVTRWDPDAQEYKQNVSFAGADPCLLMQTTVDYRIPDSDIWLFYRRDNTIYWRRQGDNYTIENTLFSDSQIAVLDQAQALPYRYQLLVSDLSGEPLDQQLISDIFPIPLLTEMLGLAGGLRDGEYVNVVIPNTFEDSLTASSSGLRSGVYEEAILQEDLLSELDAQAGGLRDGNYINVIMTEVLKNELEAEVSGLRNGSYTNVILTVLTVTEELTANAGGLRNGSYSTP
jgi:hypothetical protein